MIWEKLIVKKGLTIVFLCIPLFPNKLMIKKWIFYNTLKQWRQWSSRSKQGKIQSYKGTLSKFWCLIGLHRYGLWVTASQCYGRDLLLLVRVIEHLNISLEEKRSNLNNHKDFLLNHYNTQPYKTKSYLKRLKISTEKNETALYNFPSNKIIFTKNSFMKPVNY